MRRRFGWLTVLFCCILCAVATFTVTVLSYQRLVNNNLADYKQLRTKYQKLLAVEQLVDDVFVGEIDEQFLMDFVLTGYAYGLGDAHTYYLNAEDYKASFEGVAGDFAGIGIRVLPDETGAIYIASVMIGSPAEAAGVQHGDRIVQVEGRSVVDIGYATAVNDLLDVAGSTAVFSVMRGEPGGEGEQQVEFSVVRQRFATTTVTGKKLSNGYGYIRITEYDMKTPEQFAGVLNTLLEQNVDGLIFDMRENPGGELNAICTILDRLVPEGTIIEIRDKKGVTETIKSDATELDLPMAVLVNGNTASAAELFSATLRDYDKAVLVGTTTYGKGSVQTMYPLADGTGINLTTGLYYPPSGVSYNGEGLKPDVEIDLPTELHKKNFFLDYEEDVQLQAAVSALDAESQLQPAA